MRSLHNKKGVSKMAKTHRGAELRELPNRGRGTCPICARTGVKLLYDLTVKGKNIKVCKKCRKRKAT